MTVIKGLLMEIKRLQEDIKFLCDQHDVVEHKQDTDKIQAIRKQYNLKRGWD